MTSHPLAGTRVPETRLVDITRVRSEYYARKPDISDPTQRVSFGTSGHRGSSFHAAFTESHVLAITQAICDYRSRQEIGGPLFLGKDTHALSEPAFMTTLEVLSANGVTVMIDERDGYTPTPAISHAILSHNHSRTSGFADGIVLTPSHNPPEDGGFKYNPPSGGPAETSVTQWIEARANELLLHLGTGVARIPYERARYAATTRDYDYVGTYVNDLPSVIDMDIVRHAGLTIGVDPLGGASLALWKPIAERFGLDIEIVNDQVDPTFGFMPSDRDGRIRMDCSSPFAMAGLLALKDHFDIAFGNDPDADRHGIVTSRAGLMNPNHYLAAAIFFLFKHRPAWHAYAAVGKTIVTSSMIDRVAATLERTVLEMPVGFKWFVPGLLDGSLGFGGEESAGATFLRRDGTVWTTDKDGIVMNLLAVEMMARTGRDPSEVYSELTRELGDPAYERIDAPATPEEKAVLLNLSPFDVTAKELAGEPIQAVTGVAPGNGASIGGLKVMSANGWFAARPSGTENVYKLYAESFRGRDHLRRIQDEAKALIAAALGASTKRSA
jgi:phosphoglucomutase